jgi:CO/xanthine dehydrogenase Mo-binding subunit
MRDRLQDAKNARQRASDLEWEGNYPEADRLRVWASQQQWWVERDERYEPNF